MSVFVGAAAAAGDPLSSPDVSMALSPDPIAAAMRAIESVLAAAHEAGQHDAVRLLHAVTALLAAAPRH
jgi:hypothetical protein